MVAATLEAIPSMLSEFDRENIDHILGGKGDWFSAGLIRLIAKADGLNRERLRRGFPEAVAAFERWEQS